MRHYQYPLPTGQIIVSPVELSYAYDPNLTIDLEKVTKQDFAKLSILADETMADIVTELSDGRRQWRMPATAIAQPADPANSSKKNFCVIKDGILYIRDGRKYTKLDTFTESASRETLAFTLNQVAFQTALCQAALAGHEVENTLSTQAV